MITGHSHDFSRKNFCFLYAFECYLYDAKNSFVIDFLALYAMRMVTVRTVTYSSCAV